MVNIDPDPAALGINTAARYGEMFASGEVNSQLFCQPGWCQRTHHLFYPPKKSLVPLPHMVRGCPEPSTPVISADLDGGSVPTVSPYPQGTDLRPRSEPESRSLAQSGDTS